MEFVWEKLYQKWDQPPPAVRLPRRSPQMTNLRANCVSTVCAQQQPQLPFWPTEALLNARSSRQPRDTGLGIGPGFCALPSLFLLSFEARFSTGFGFLRIRHSFAPTCNADQLCIDREKSRDFNALTPY